MTDDSLKKLQDSLLRLKSQNKSPLESMLESLFQAQGQEVAETARRCSIPRWFDAGIIAALSDTSISTEEAEAMLEKINDWEFVQNLGGGHFAYRREVRQYLRSQMSQKQADLFKSLNQRLHSYFDSKLTSLGNLNERSWIGLRGDQISFLREKLYHLLQVNVEAGFQLFQSLFRGAHRLFLIGESAALLKFVLELDTTELSESNRNLLEYFRAMQQNAEGEWQAAETTLLDLQKRSIAGDLRVQVQTLLGSIYLATRRVDPAITAFQDAQKTAGSLNLARQNAVLSNNLGNAYLAKNDLGNAEKHFQQALTQFRKLGGTEESQVLNNLGTVRLRQERRNEAFEFLEKSLALKSQIGDQFGAAITQENLGILSQQISADSHNAKTSKLNSEKALQYYTSSLATFQLMGAISNQAKVLYRLANFHYQARENTKATGFLRESLSLYKSLGLKKEIENLAPLAKNLGLSIS